MQEQTWNAGKILIHVPRQFTLTAGNQFSCIVIIYDKNQNVLKINVVTCFFYHSTLPQSKLYPLRRKQKRLSYASIHKTKISLSDHRTTTRCTISYNWGLTLLVGSPVPIPNSHSTIDKEGETFFQARPGGKPLETPKRVSSQQSRIGNFFCCTFQRIFLPMRVDFLVILFLNDNFFSLNACIRRTITSLTDVCTLQERVTTLNSKLLRKTKVTAIAPNAVMISKACCTMVPRTIEFLIPFHVTPKIY